MREGKAESILGGFVLREWCGGFLTFFWNPLPPSPAFVPEVKMGGVKDRSQNFERFNEPGPRTVEKLIPISQIHLLTSHGS